jgi:hypothetical protein
MLVAGTGTGTALGITERLDGLQRRHPVAGFPLAVVYKFLDDQGSYLAALIAYYAFVSLFALLLLLSTVLGWVLVGHSRGSREGDAFGVEPIPGHWLPIGKPRHLSGGITGVVIGVLGAAYGGLGVVRPAERHEHDLGGVQGPAPRSLQGAGPQLAAAHHCRRCLGRHHGTGT